MSIPDYAKQVLYPESPFLPVITIPSAMEIIGMVNEDGLHPASAIAHEVRFLGKLNSLEIYEAAEWIGEKFSVDENDIADFIFGFRVPPSLLIALDMIQEYSHEETMHYLFNPEGEDYKVIVDFIGNQMKRAKNLVVWADPNPAITGTAIYDHCSVEVFSMNNWYNIGVQASRHLFDSFTELFDVIHIEDNQNDE